MPYSDHFSIASEALTALVTFAQKPQKERKIQFLKTKRKILNSYLIRQNFAGYRS